MKRHKRGISIHALTPVSGKPVHLDQSFHSNKLPINLSPKMSLKTNQRPNMINENLMQALFTNQQ